MNTPAPRLRLILGDQLQHDSPQLAQFDPARDRVLMIEAPGEATHVWSHPARIALFLSAMRHYAVMLRARGIALDYVTLDDPEYADAPALVDRLRRRLEAYSTERGKASGTAELVIVEPGEWRLAQAIEQLAVERGIALTVLPDTHFLCSRSAFAGWARGKRELRMEYFYRWQRRQQRVLLDAGGEPEGGQWNFDADNRGAFPKSGPGRLPQPTRFTPDAITRDVIDLVNTRFATHPGSLAHFDWPVTPADARAALDDFLAHRLAHFGRYQDAIWTGEPWLYHSRLSQAMNMKLLDPRDVIAGAERIWRAGKAPLEATEGFIRQVLGWREYVRGIYWHFMPEYEQRNALGADRPLPHLYWTADTEMNCLKDALTQTLRHGYAHHIQRLMVTGLFAMLLGVKPQEVHRWYLAVYVDAVEWVELPNTLGMSQFADGGVMASKPYCASGAYLDRMSNACGACRFNPKIATGPDACPFTTLYWDFLARHEKLLKKNPRMAMQLKNLARKDAADLRSIRRQADGLREASP
jgi:deoxyribodipyrimidine photolyase-related protein